MMTIVTDVRVRLGAEDKWDAVVRDRMAAAKERPGLVSAQLLRSESQPNQRVIVGTWRTRADWEARDGREGAGLPGPALPLASRGARDAWVRPP